MKRHHWIVRLTHWINFVALTIMIGSGLRIFNAYPRFARRGETFCCYPWEGTPIPGWLTFGGWLAGARQWHFAMMWVLVVNGLVYLGFVYLHGEWRDLVPRRGYFRDAWEMLKFYLFLRRDHPVQGKHNALQRGVYFILPWIGLLTVLTGIAIWKPVQLAPLTDLFGGYVWARYWHFVLMVHSRGAELRPHLHGVRRGSVFDALHHNRRIQSEELSRRAKRAAVPQPAPEQVPQRRRRKHDDRPSAVHHDLGLRNLCVDTRRV